MVDIREMRCGVSPFLSYKGKEECLLEFQKFARILKRHLETQKVFIPNPQRMRDVNHATEMAQQLFPEAKITIEDDPLQLGALILCIEDFDLAVRETELFDELVGKADNFEIYSVGNENVKIAILFNHALTRITN